MTQRWLHVEQSSFQSRKATQWITSVGCYGVFQICCDNESGVHSETLVLMQQTPKNAAYAVRALVRKGTEEARREGKHSGCECGVHKKVTRGTLSLLLNN